MTKMTRRQLRAMYFRWERDLATLEAAFPHVELEFDRCPETETIRNLATAIANMIGVIDCPIPLTRRGERHGRGTPSKDHPHG